MSWARFDDQMLDHPKLLAIGPIGFALHAAAIIWCARNMTDGRLPLGKVSTLLDLRGVIVSPNDPTGRWLGEEPDTRIWSAPDALDIAYVLVGARLWEHDGPDFKVHDFLHYNPSKADVLEKREQARDRQNRWRERHAVTNASPNALVPGTGEGSICLKKARKGSAEGKPWRTVPAGETLTEARLAMGTKLGLPPDVVQRFWLDMGDHVFKSPKKDVDRTWLNWVEKEASRWAPPRSARPAGSPRSLATSPPLSEAEKQRILHRELDRGVTASRDAFAQSAGPAVLGDILKQVVKG